MGGSLGVGRTGAWLIGCRSKLVLQLEQERHSVIGVDSLENDQRSYQPRQFVVTDSW